MRLLESALLLLLVVCFSHAADEQVPRDDNAMYARSQSSFQLSTSTKRRVAKMWSSIEESKPIELAHRRKVAQVSSDSVNPGPDFEKRLWQSKVYDTPTINYLKYPTGFIYGTASASAQVEGAIKDDNRGPSVWDSYAHKVPGGMRNNDTFDVATNFRYLYPIDLARVAAMGVKAYSFSVSWSRVMPLGRGDVSQEGLQFYEDLVDEIKRNGMEPVATLFHWDVPLALEEDYGSFLSDQIADDFVDYAALIFTRLGEKGVKTFITFNEPQVFCGQRYGLSIQHIHNWTSIPTKVNYLCSGNLLKAHGRAHELFQELRQNKTISESSKISYKNSGSYNVPYRFHNKHDEDAVQRGIDFGLGLFSEPVHNSGNYPKIVRDEVPKAWLPELTEADQKRLKGSATFFSTDYYGSSISKATELDGGYEACVGNNSHPAWPSCTDSTTSLESGWPLGESSDITTNSWLFNTAGVLRYHLVRIKEQFDVHEGIILTEFGWAEKDEANKTEVSDLRMDVGRQRYYTEYLGETLKAIEYSGVPLLGAFLWSATSNVEWEVGLQSRFGLQSVNYTDPNLSRTYLGSFYVVRDFFKKHLHD